MSSYPSSVFLSSVRLACRALPFCLLLLTMAPCHGEPIVFIQPAAQADLDDAAFKKLVADLDSNHFGVRHAATKTLIESVDPASATRLTVAQLRALRALALDSDTPLDKRRLAGEVLTAWARLNPNTLGPARDVLAGIALGDTRYVRRFDEFQFEIGPFLISITGSKVAFPAWDKVMKSYNEALDQLNAGFPDQVLPALQALKKAIEDLPDKDVIYLTAQDRKDTTKAAVLKKLDEAIKSAGDLLNKVNASIGDPPPGAAPKLAVPGSGMIDTGKTFGLALNGNVTPGTLTLVRVPQQLAIGTPPPGFRFFGPVFILTVDTGVQLLGGSVQIGIEYGDPLLEGLPTSLASRFQLTRLADGVYEPFDTMFNDLGGFRFTGAYTPGSGAGIDQFGEFAIIVPAHAPNTLLLGLLGLGLMVMGQYRPRAS